PGSIRSAAHLWYFAFFLNFEPSRAFAVDQLHRVTPLAGSEDIDFILEGVRDEPSCRRVAN
ncbi:MAG TPA: hypothetical protein PK365_17665, partial [Nitrospira sp.]|nr:hypothetical protein [Nitrospira sp.]